MAIGPSMISKGEKRGFTLHIHFRGQDYNSDSAEMLQKRLRVYDPFQLNSHIPLSEVKSVLEPFEGGYEAV